MEEYTKNERRLCLNTGSRSFSLNGHFVVNVLLGILRDQPSQSLAAAFPDPMVSSSQTVSDVTGSVITAVKKSSSMTQAKSRSPQINVAEWGLLLSPRLGYIVKLAAAYLLDGGVSSFGAAGLPNFASSTAALTCTSVRSNTDLPSVQVCAQWKGILMPLTSL